MLNNKHFLIGFKTDNFVILASDKNVISGGCCVSNDANKNVKLGEKLYMSSISERANIDRFNDLAQYNYRLNKFQGGSELSPSAMHHFLRKTVADSLRSENPWNVDVLLGGYDVIEGKTWLSFINHFGAESKNQNYYLFGSIRNAFIDNTAYRLDMSSKEAMNVVKECIRKSHNLPSWLLENDKRPPTSSIPFNAVIIDKDGARQKKLTA